MTVSDAQFAAWLDTDAPMVVLCEIDFGYESGGSPAVGTVYLSDAPYTTGPADSPPHIAHRPIIKEVPKLKRAIGRDKLEGGASVSVSELRLENSDASADFMLSLVLDGYETRFYIGGPTWARADFRLAFVAVAERARAPNDREVTIRLRDKRLLLDRQMIGNQVGGTGAEASQFLPLYWGSIFNAEARIYDSATARWAVLSNYTGAVVNDVRDNGNTLTESPVSIEDGVSPTITVDAGTDVFTKTAHGLAVNDVVTPQSRGFIGDTWAAFAMFAGMTARQYWVIAVPTADTFKLSETKGGASIDVTGTTYLGPSGGGFSAGRLKRTHFFDDLTNTGRIQLSSSATGRVTVDLTALNSYVTTPFSFIRYLIETYGKVTTDDVDADYFTAADTAYAGKIGTVYHNFSVQARENVITAVEALSASSFGWVAPSREGKFICGLVDVSGIASQSASRTLGRFDLVDAAGLAVENDPVDIGRATVAYNANHTVQADGLAAAVSETNRRRYALAFLGLQRSAEPTGTAYSTNPALYHRTMVEKEPRQIGELADELGYGSGVSLTFPTGLADEIVADAAPTVQFITARAGLKFFDAELGDVVRLTYPRYGLDDGANARVISIELNLTGRQVSLEMVRQVAPDTSTAAYS